MKNFILSILLLLGVSRASAQDASASINREWYIYASDTSRTYAQIVTICDSLYALAGYGAVTDTLGDTISHDGDPYWKYQVWKGFWASRWDVATGKLHDFAIDAIADLSPNKTTSGTTNCAGTSPLQSSLTSGPVGWKFIGPQGITPSPQHLGQVHDIAVNPANQFL